MPSSTRIPPRTLPCRCDDCREDHGRKRRDQWRRKTMKMLDGNIKMNTTAEDLVLLGACLVVMTLAICTSLFVILAVMP